MKKPEVTIEEKKFEPVVEETAEVEVIEETVVNEEPSEETVVDSKEENKVKPEKEKKGSKKEKEQNEQKVEEKKVEEQPVETQDDKKQEVTHEINITKHKFKMNDNVWVPEFSNTRRSGDFAQVVNSFQFNPRNGDVERVMITDKIQYKIKGKAGSLYDEEDVCWTEEEVKALCDKKNNAAA